jgi:hypothetical protein
MRGFASRLAVFCAGALMMGCTPENSAPPPEPAAIDEPPSVVKGGPQPAIKKKKEPGVGNIIPRTSGRLPAGALNRPSKK